jgi:hypothetical protein
LATVYSFCFFLLVAATEKLSENLM